MNWLKKIYQLIYPPLAEKYPIKLIDYFGNWEKIIHDNEPHFGVAGQRVVLRSKNVLLHRRIEALASAASMNYASKNEILRGLLPETTDEIRLLAFQLLETQEKAISKKINWVNKLVKHAKTNSELHNGYKIIAQLYYELVYQNLVQPELRDSILATAFEYVQKALKTDIKDPIAWALQGKIQLKQQDYEGAESSLLHAMELCAQPRETVPYIAEMHFKKREFLVIPKFFEEHPSLSDLPRVGTVARFWSEDKHII
ncbi:MAG: hypothetical protein HKM04_04425 [Legionellales bacterium]|nr:hypothetical protein [Legionellales bacterium]